MESGGYTEVFAVPCILRSDAEIARDRLFALLGLIEDQRHAIPEGDYLQIMNLMKDVHQDTLNFYKSAIGNQERLKIILSSLQRAREKRSAQEDATRDRAMLVSPTSSGESAFPLRRSERQRAVLVRRFGT